MAVLPDGNLAMIQWFEDRVASWLADPASIGLSAEQADSLLAFTGAARAAYQAASQIRSDSKSATVTYTNGAGDLRGFGADLIKTIKAFAEATDDTNVYALANVPPPADPEPLGPPGKPTNITSTINSSGHLLLKWKANNAASSTGVYFMVERQLNDEPGFTLVGGSGSKDFTDVKIPLGTAKATYIIIPFRGDLAGEPSNQTTVQFGVNIPGPGGGSSGDNELGMAA